MAEIYPIHILIASLAGCMNRRQGEVLEYLIEENRVLKEQLKGKALRLNDDQRRRLAAKGKRIGRRLLTQVATIVTPDTILRWHRKLIAAKWTYKTNRVGRPGLMKEIRELIVRFARENCGWGYCRIEGALRNVGHRVSPTTIRNVLKQHGIKPAPDRPTTWRAFLRAHWDQIAGTDFFTVEVWTAKGLKTFYVLFMIELDTRRVHLGVPIADCSWNLSQADSQLWPPRRQLAGSPDARGKGLAVAIVRRLTRVLGMLGVWDSSERVDNRVRQHSLQKGLMTRALERGELAQVHASRCKHTPVAPWETLRYCLGNS